MTLRLLEVLPILAFGGMGADTAPVAPVSTFCSPPHYWSLEALDPRFDLSREEVTDAIRRAAILWAEAVGNPLLFQEGAGDLSIRFVFDERLQDLRERDRMRDETRVSEERIRVAEEELEGMRSELARHRTVHEQRERDFRERMEEHSRTVERWNQQGGAPPEEYRRLLGIEDALERERAAVNESAEELNRLVGRVNEATGRVNEAIAEHNRRLTALAALPEETLSRVAEYRETRRGFGPFSTSVTRELDVFAFESRDHLVLIFARALGRTLGLDDSDVPGSVLEPAVEIASSGNRPELHPSDVERVRQLCAFR
jgi:hypothetical protein